MIQDWAYTTYMWEIHINTYSFCGSVLSYGSIEVSWCCQVTLSTVNSSRPSTSRAQANSNPSANSSTPLNRATVVRHRATVRNSLFIPPHTHTRQTLTLMDYRVDCIGMLPPGSGQGGSSQYSQYQQGQGQQYSSYRSSQAAPGPQTQRPYTYEQVLGTPSSCHKEICINKHQNILPDMYCRLVISDFFPPSPGSVWKLSAIKHFFLPERSWPREHYTTVAYKHLLDHGIVHSFDFMVVC